MKYLQLIKQKTALLVGVLACFTITSCNDYLNIAPPSQITPETYLRTEAELGSYTINFYNNEFPVTYNWSFGIYGGDANTDNQVNMWGDNKYAKNLWRTDMSDWNFSNIYNYNYFLDNVLPRWKAGSITGNPDNISDYIGEMYFLRGLEYYRNLCYFGDFPIVKHVLPANKEILVAASVRMPRSEVVRFIISDLDSAALLLKTVSPDGHKNRISKDCALLLKSRVCLYEGTFEKYFKGTPFVPNGPGWPGAAQNPNYQFQSGSIDNEIQYLLGQSMDAAKVVADAHPLETNTMSIPGTATSKLGDNPYFDMWSNTDLSQYGEILLWKQYSNTLGVTHNVPVYAESGNNGVGVTRSLVNSFLMANGLPIYAAGSGYAGDDSISYVRKNRDGRLWLFLKDPGQINCTSNQTATDHGTIIETIPLIYDASQEKKYVTGYAVRKGISYDGMQNGNGQGYTGLPIYRATEAYLNYIEACYEKTGSVDGTASAYWRAIRTRAGVDPDYNKTIAATDMSIESKTDWGAYSGGKVIDATLYNIRRERRDEFIAESMRTNDLQRWRSMDQLMTTPYHIEGFKLWGPMKNWYTPDQLIYGKNNSASIVSDPALSPYLRPFEVFEKNDYYNGFTWMMAHYLHPIGGDVFLQTASDQSDYSTSPVYQNPYWPREANQLPTQ